MVSSDSQAKDITMDSLVNESGDIINDTQHSTKIGRSRQGNSGTETILTEIELACAAIELDRFSTRDPNVAAICMCYGQLLVQYRVLLIRYGRREPQRVVEFSFAGHEKVFKIAGNALMDIRSSATYKNINIGEFLAHLRNIKTIILSCA